MRYPSPQDLVWLLRQLVARPDVKCAQCGADIVAPEWSEHLSEYRVRNVWSCEACGYQFEDDICLVAHGRAVGG
jgi:DNA-directed RNA polymerase subunit RPC12/RpoP